MTVRRRLGLRRRDINATAAPLDPKSNADISLMKRVCATIPEGKYADWKKTPIYYMAENLHLSYCVVHHEMDGIWKDIFYVLRNTNNKTTDYRTLIGQYDRRLGLREKVVFKNFFRRSSETVLFVRNPYVRLFSAYFDRYYVLHHSCEKIDFQEYLDRVISGIKLHLNWGITMMPPLVPLCALCDIRPFEIIKEETFLRDLRHMFERLKLNTYARDTLLGLLQNPKLFLSAILHSKLKLQYLERCPLGPELAPRFWQSLQNMGLISERMPFPATLRTINVSKNMNALVDEVINANKVVPMTDLERNTQIARAIAMAYAGIKDETIEYIQEVFKYDFEMFDYSKEKPVW